MATVVDILKNIIELCVMLYSIHVMAPVMMIVIVHDILGVDSV